MKRSPLKPSTKPLKRTAFKPKPDWKPLAKGTSKLKPKAMKTSRHKMTPIRKSAKWESCTIRIPGVAFHDIETVVWCHSNASEHGKGMGLKAKDEFGAYGCQICHAIYDGQMTRPTGVTKEQVDAAFERAMEESRAILIIKNLIEVKNEN
jgi:hypothetical protein